MVPPPPRSRSRWTSGQFLGPSSCEAYLCVRMLRKPFFQVSLLYKSATHRSAIYWGPPSNRRLALGVRPVLAREDKPDDALSNILEAIKSKIERRELTSTLVDVATIEAVVLELSRDVDDLAQVTAKTIYWAQWRPDP
jgi:hypothetical protein